MFQSLIGRTGLLFCVATLLVSDSFAENEQPVVVSIQTNQGSIVVELYPDKAPKTVENFLSYVRDGFYDDTIFHRVIAGFMIQGGGRDANMKSKSVGSPVENEAANGLKNDRYTIAMARTADPNSATSQFFINTADNDNLNRPNPDGHGYAVFGKVIEGTEVVDKIEAVQTGMHPDNDFAARMMSDVPKEPMIIESIAIVSGD